MSTMEVQILSTKYVKPSIQTPSHLQNLKLSLFDQLSLPVYAYMIFYYNGEGDKSTNADRVLRLEESLSAVLTKFYPLAGRFVKGDGKIDCSDDGVEYFEAQASGTLSEILGREPESALLDQLIPCDTSTVTETGLVTIPLLSVQITAFACGGLAVGFRISHIIADAYTMLAFLSTWAETSRTGFSDKIFPTYDLLSSIFPACILPEIEIPIPETESTDTKIVRRRFLFDAETIARIREKLCGNSSTEKYKPSKVVMVVALVWKALIGVARAKNGYLRDSLIGVAMNWRGKSSLSISDNPLGNFYTIETVHFSAKEATEPDFEELVILIGDRLRDASAKLANADAEEISSMLVEYSRSIVENPYHNAEVDTFACSSWCNFPLYEADFGWGKPNWISAESSSATFEGFVLVDAINGDGIEVSINLKDDNMASFEQDAHVLAFASQVKYNLTT